MFNGKSIASKACIRKEASLQISYIGFHGKCLEKDCIKPEVSRRKGIMMLVEINGIESK